MKTIKIALTLILACAVLFMHAGIALALPPQPCTVYGTLTSSGASVPVGTPITAWINGVQYASSTVYLYNGSPTYTLDIPGDDTSTPGVIEGGAIGNTITFRIAGLTAAQTTTWQNDHLTRLDLTIPTLHLVYLPLLNR